MKPRSWQDDEAILDEFEDAWQTGEPKIEEFAARLGDDPTPLLHELALIDLEHQLRRGKGVRTEDYLARFATLAADRECVLDLLNCEAEHRRPELTLDECRERFPELSDDLTARMSSTPRPTRRTHFRRVECAHCEKAFAVRDASEGDEISCPHCATSFLLDGGDAAPSLPQLGKFLLLEQVGEGAFGTVYRAQDTELNRVVAVKIPRGWAFATKEDEERFVREARNVARLSHPGIVPVFEVGREDAFPYIVSEFIEGETLAELSGGASLGFREIAQLAAAIAEALAYAHDNGVVHRDLKPNNIMLGMSDEGGWEHPKLLDFGLARDLGRDAGMTREGQILGTPAYMAPEQARGEGHAADGRSDVYSLGAVLFGLLTGGPPFRGNAQMVMHQAIHDEPPIPRRLNSDIPIDLETICLRCLEKEPRKRYQTASDVADELRRFLRREPIHSRQISKADRLWRWCLRNKTVALLTVGLFVALTGGLIGVAAQWLRAEDLAERESGLREKAQTALKGEQQARADAVKLKIAAQSAEAKTRRHLYVSHMNLVQQAWEEASVARMRGLLRRHIPKPGEEDLRTFAWHYWWRKAHMAVASHARDRLRASASQISAEKRQVLIAGVGRTVSTVNAETGKVFREFAIEKGSVTASAYSPSGDRFAIGDGFGKVSVWSSTTGKLIRRFEAHKKSITALAFVTNDETLATAALDKQVTLWDLRKGEVVAHLKKGRVREIRCMAFSKRERSLICGGYEIERWDLITNRLRGSKLAHRGLVYAIAIHPDGDRFASAGIDRQINFWNLRSLSALPGIRGLPHAVMNLAWSPTGDRLAGGGGRTVHVWETRTQREIAQLKGHTGRVTVAKFLDEKSMVSIEEDGSSLLWKVAALSAETVLGHHVDRPVTVAVSPNGKIAATAGIGGLVRIWNTADGILLRELTTNRVTINSLQFSPSGDRLFAAAAGGTVFCWQKAAGEPRPFKLHGNSYVWNVGFSADGRVAFSTSDGFAGRIWDTATGVVKHRILCGRWMAISSDGRFAVTIRDDRFEIVTLATGNVRTIQAARKSRWIRAAVSPDGKSFAVCNNEGDVELWDVDAGKRKTTLGAHSGDVYAITFSPTGKTLVTAGGDRTIKLWDVRTSEVQTVLKGHTAPVRSVVFSKEGTTLISVGEDRAVRIWRAAAEK